MVLLRSSVSWEVVDFEAGPARAAGRFAISAAIAVGVAVLVAFLLQGVDVGAQAEEPPGPARTELVRARWAW
jgi:hypothetical protein